MLKQLREANIRRDKLWDPENKVSLEFRAIELGGEIGELLNVIKKLLRENLGLRGSRASIEDAIGELADVIICTDLLAMELGINLEEAVRFKYNDVSKRIGLDVYLE